MADDASRKPFIIKHMNADHSRSLSLYLRAYCNLSTKAAASPNLEDVRLDDLVISTPKGGRYTIPFTPPLKDLTETRPRVVAMHNESLRRLGLSDTKITTYAPPRGGQIIGFALCLAILLAYSRRANFEPGSLLYETAGLGRFPRFTAFSYTYQPWIWGLLALPHAFEAVVLLGWQRLRKYNVTTFSGVWWLWIVLGFVEGFPAWKRFDALVKKVEGKEHEKTT
ncbi:hypothetical protein BJY01DRAFT_216352 [Aspergillus pseudoustus]|uniref:DUF2470 domain-containing protein n=1 Tax=Aspergillus pseudoustus TaxID=1810923 RepID=A0ABR4JT23_9EURO